MAVSVHVLILGIVGNADVAPSRLTVSPRGVGDSLGLGNVAFHVDGRNASSLDIARTTGAVVFEEIDEALVWCGLYDVCTPEGIATQPTVGFFGLIAIDPVGNIVGSGVESSIDGAHGIRQAANGCAVSSTDHGVVVLAHQGIPKGPDDFAVDDASVAEITSHVMLLATGKEETHGTLVADVCYLGRYRTRPRWALTLLWVDGADPANVVYSTDIVLHVAWGCATHGLLLLLLIIIELGLELVECFVHGGQISREEVDVQEEEHLYEDALALNLCLDCPPCRGDGGSGFAGFCRMEEV